MLGILVHVWSKCRCDPCGGVTAPWSEVAARVRDKATELVWLVFFSIVFFVLNCCVPACLLVRCEVLGLQVHELQES